MAPALAAGTLHITATADGTAPGMIRIGATMDGQAHLAFTMAADGIMAGAEIMTTGIVPTTHGIPTTAVALVISVAGTGTTTVIPEQWWS